jgi:rhodanese-related sulfurtransferase
MATPIDRDGVQQLVGSGAQLVEVLPAESYEQEHLPGAISLPLARLDGEARSRLRDDAPIIVYCYDYQ